MVHWDTRIHTVVEMLTKVLGSYKMVEETMLRTLMPDCHSHL